MSERHFVELFSELGRRWAAKFFSEQSPESLAIFAKRYAAHPWKTTREYQAQIVTAYSSFMTPLTPERRRHVLEELVPGFTSVDFEGGLVWGRAAFLAAIAKYVDEFGGARQPNGFKA